MGTFFSNYDTGGFFDEMFDSDGKPRPQHRLCSDLNYETVENIIRGGLHEYLDATRRRLIDIHAAMNTVYFDWIK